MLQFQDIPVNSTFMDRNGDVCFKTSSTTATTDYCAKGFCIELHQNEFVTLLQSE